MNPKDPFKELKEVTHGFLSKAELSEHTGTTLRPARPKVTLDRDRQSRPHELLSDEGGSSQLQAPPLVLQILLPCQLPTKAAFWLPELARKAAAEHGPVALVQLGSKTCSVQIFGGSAGTIDLPKEATHRIGDIASWIAQHAARVLIVPRSLDDDETILETELPIILMTGPQQHATIGAYARVKELAIASRSAELSTPQLGLVIAGTKEAEARKIAARIRNTASRFLGLTLSQEHVLPAMGPDSSGASAGTCHDVSVGPTYATEHLVAGLRRAALDRGGVASQVQAKPLDPEPIEPSSTPVLTEDLLTKLEDSSGEVGTPEEPTEILEPRPPASVLEPVGTEQQDDSEERRALEAIFEEPAPATSESLLNPASISEFKPEPEFESEPEPIAQPSVADQPSVSTLVLEDEVQPSGSECARFSSLIPGLEPINLDCPVDHRIELALDGARRLHLVALESSLRNLRAAEAWATRNHSILDEVIPGGLPPFEHRGIRFDVLVEDAANSSDLHKTGLFLHLLEGDPENRRTRALNNEQSAFNGA